MRPIDGFVVPHSAAMISDPTDDRHPTLYFEDGNVVLSAIETKTQRRRYFRVHRSVLCRHSLVLADLFTIPPLRDESSSHAIVEVYDGVLHVQMPDSAEDLESLDTLHTLCGILQTICELNLYAA